jgi:hypothetical protein
MEHGLFAPRHGTATLAEEDVRSAGTIVMSMQYGEQLRDPIPMGAFLAICLLQVSFGSWYRLQRDSQEATEKDKDVDSSANSEKARFMMDWCRTKVNEMLHLWDGEQMPSQAFVDQVDVLEGGSPEGWRDRRVFPL